MFFRDSKDVSTYILRFPVRYLSSRVRDGHHAAVTVSLKLDNISARITHTINFLTLCSWMVPLLNQPYYTRVHLHALEQSNRL